MDSEKDMNARAGEEADLVVLGGGGAGLCAALAATENGCGNIVVLEKRVLRPEIRRWAAGLSPLKAQCKEGRVLMHRGTNTSRLR